MKYKVNIILFLIGLISHSVFSQGETLKGYRIEGDYVVFTFDKRDYTEATDEKTQKKLDFDDFNIKNVVVSGNFNSWSRDSWKMSKIDDYIYELRKKITDFKDEFDWEFKFVINNRIWAEPNESTRNIVPATDGYKNYYTYNLKMYNAYPSKKGNTKFKLKGYKNAKKVIITGSFNKWHEQLFEMEKTNYGWELTLQMKPNKYEYRFIIDGYWIEDPENPLKVPNEFGEYNSVIDISANVEFFLEGFNNAKKIILAGSFNHWSEDSFQMRRVKNGWVYSMKLPSGKHHYKFIIDGQWKVDPSNPIKEFDGHGNINSVKMVR